MLLRTLIPYMIVFPTALTWTTYKIGVIVDEFHDSLEFSATALANSISKDLKIDLLWLNITHDINKITGNLHGAISLLNCQQTMLMENLFRTKGVPHVSLSTQTCKYHRRYSMGNTINFDLGFRLQSQLVHDLVRERKWEHVTLVFGQSTGNDLRNRLILDLSEEKILIYPVVLSTNDEDLQKVISYLPPHVVLFGNHSEVKTFFRTEAMKAKELMTAVLMSHDLSLQEVSRLSEMCDPCQILFAQFDSIEYQNRIRLQSKDDRVKMNLSNQQHYVLDAIKQFIFALNDTAPTCMSTSFNTTKTKCEQQIATNRRCLDYLSDTLQRLASTRIPAFKIISISNFPTISINVIGRWTTHSRFSRNEEDVKLTSGLSGRTLKVAVAPFNGVYLSRTWKDNATSYQGFIIEIVSELSAALNFSIEYLEPADNLYGSPTGNGSWDGMTQLVVNGEADLAVGGFTVTHQRAQVIDHTTSFIEQSLGILTPAAGESTQIFQFLKPFSLSVWVIIIVFMLTTATSLWMVTCVRYRHQRESDMTSHLEYWMLTISCLCAQGPAFYPSSLSARCLLGFWLFFSVLVVAMYTANLVAVLTVKTQTIPINSLQDLANNEALTVFVQYGTSTWTLFEDADNEIYKKINERKVAAKSPAEAVELVEAGNAVFIAGRRLLLLYAGRSCGKTRVADERFSRASLAFVLPMDSPHIKAFNIKVIIMCKTERLLFICSCKCWDQPLLEETQIFYSSMTSQSTIASLVESGLVKMWENKWLNPSYNCSKKDKSSKELSLETLSGVFIAYGIIVALSFLFVFLELLTEAGFRCSQNHDKPISDTRESAVCSQPIQ